MDDRRVGAGGEEQVMAIPRWRVVLIGGAAVALAVTGAGWALGASQGSGDIAGPRVAGVDGAPVTAAPDRSGGGGDPAFLRGTALRRLALARSLVHAEARYVDRAGNLVEHHVDHGTIHSMGRATITIDAADGATVTVTVDDETVVRLGRAPGELGDLEVGDEIVIHSRIDDGVALARHVVRLPARETVARS
jgi:hypothetical protein